MVVRMVKWFRHTAGILLLGCLLMWPGLSAADEWENPPFNLPYDAYLPIPDGRGVSFFYDVWVDYSGRGGGGPVTITSEVIARYDSDSPIKENPYKVLYTGPNYVLFLEKSHVYGGKIVSTFGVFLLQNGPVLMGDPYISLLRRWHCTDLTMKNEGAYDWPIEKVEAAFWNGWCAEGLDKPYEEWKSLSPYWWSSFIYNRQKYQ